MDQHSGDEIAQSRAAERCDPLVDLYLRMTLVRSRPRGVNRCEHRPHVPRAVLPFRRPARRARMTVAEARRSPRLSVWGCLMPGSGSYTVLPRTGAHRSPFRAL